MEGIIMKYRLLILVTTLFAALLLKAEPIIFRSGKVLTAELSTSAIKITKVNPAAPLSIPETPIYAVVSIKLDAERSVSIFDYSLEVFGKEINCAAIRTKRDFEFTTENISQSSPLQLLFIADSKFVGKLASEKLTLKSRLTPANDVYAVEIPFAVIGKKAPMSLDNIPHEGTFGAVEEKK